jgi:hypothetical protein
MGKFSFFMLKRLKNVGWIMNLEYFCKKICKIDYDEEYYYFCSAIRVR